MKLWHLIIVNSECSLSPLCWPLFNIVTQEQKGRFDFSYWTSDPSLDFGDCGVVFLCRKVEHAKFLQQHPFFPSLLWLQPYVVSEWPHWLGMWTQNSHLISQYFFYYCRIQICKKQKKKTITRSLFEIIFTLNRLPVYTQKRQYIVKRKTSILFLWQSWLNIPMLLVASAEQTHFVSHFSYCPPPLSNPSTASPLCFTLLWGFL